MTHERRYGVERGDGLTWLTCEPCQKRGYSSRGAAKSVARRLKGRVNVYRCPVQAELIAPVYHVGHLPKSVRTGRMDRGVLHPKPRA